MPFTCRLKPDAVDLNAIAAVLGAPLVIDEKISVFGLQRTEVRLYARVHEHLVGALDFTVMGKDVHVNVIYVKPEFRRLGIGSALVQNLRRRYPENAYSM